MLSLLDCQEDCPDEFNTAAAITMSRNRGFMKPGFKSNRQK